MAGYRLRTRSERIQGWAQQCDACVDGAVEKSVAAESFSPWVSGSHRVLHEKVAAGTIDRVHTIAGAHAGTSYTVKLDADRIALEVLSDGSPAGGSGSESHLGVDADAFAAFLGKLGLTSDELPGYIASLRGVEWREFWYLVSEFATSRFTWFDTNWD